MTNSAIMPDVEEGLGLGKTGYYQKYYAERCPEEYTWLLAEIIKHGQPGNILDLGCGLGFFVEIADKWGMDVWGYDGSDDAICMALSRNPKLNIVRHLLSQPLPHNECSIDNILLNQVIEHIPNFVMTNVLCECKRVLRRNGMIFIYSPNRGNKVEALKDPTHINLLHPSQLHNVLLSYGFEIVREPNSVRFPTRSPILSRFFGGLMKTSLKDWLSASTNAYARKNAD